MKKEKEKLARQIHTWYLEACEELDPDSYNSNAQKPYENLTEDQKFMDRYLADKILGLIDNKK